MYAGTARNGFSTPLDLSGLAAGLYHLKVSNGHGYALRSISIEK